MAQDKPYGVQTDESGRPFVWQGDKKNYISPVAFGGERPEDTTGIFRQRPQWNQNKGKWETPIDWGNILSIGAGAGIAAPFVAPAVGSLFGGGAGAGGAAGSTGALASTPIAGMSSLPAGVAGSLSGGGVLASTPIAGMSALPTGVAGSVGSGGSSGGSMLGSIGKWGRKALSNDKLLDVASTGLGRYSQAGASNRGTQAEIMLDAQDALERQLLAREREKRDAQGSAYQRAVMADMANNWRPSGRPEGIPTISFGGGLSPTGRGASQALFDQVMKRLNAPDLTSQSGMPAYTSLMDDPNFRKNLKAGKGEKAAGIASAALPLAGLFF